jgi:hypothetical protein
VALLLVVLRAKYGREMAELGVFPNLKNTDNFGLIA